MRKSISLIRQGYTLAGIVYLKNIQYNLKNIFILMHYSVKKNRKMPKMDFTNGSIIITNGDNN